MHPLTYLTARRLFVFMDEWLFYSVVAGMYYADMPTVLTVSVVMGGGAAMAYSYKCLSNVERRVFTHCQI